MNEKEVISLIHEIQMFINVQNYVKASFHLGILLESFEEKIKLESFKKVFDEKYAEIWK